jgi:hypothetical protein
MYYEKIAQEQNRRLRSPLAVIGELLCRSELGIDPPEDFGHEYNAIAEMSEKEKAELAQKVTEAVLGAEEQGVISQRTAVLELRQLSQTTGVFSNITDEDVEAADDTLPDPNEVLNDPLADPASGPGAGPQARPQEERPH